MSSAIISPAQPEQILKGLGKLWTSLGEEEKHQGKPTVLRACAMTLIVATDEADEGYAASQTISELMREHPSRGIVLAVSETAEQALQARVLAQCWKPFGKAQQICCEQIEITAQPGSWPNIGPTLIGLIAADLPVIFWCRHQAALSPGASVNQKAGLEAILELSSKLIVDNRDRAAYEAFELMNRLRSRGRIVADLEWTRLTPWREPIAQIFDNPARQNEFANFHTVEIGYAGDHPGAGCFYAGAWFSAANNCKVLFKQVNGFAFGIHNIRLQSETESIEFERTSCDCMSLHSTSGRERKYSFTDPTAYNLMHEELSIVGTDPVFETAFRRAQELIGEYK